MAVVHFKMSPAEFWELTWFEWSFYLVAIEQKQEEVRYKMEHDWSIARVMWATICNIHRDTKKKPQPFKPEDLVKLSFDTQDDEQVERKPLTSKEMKELLGTNFKRNGRE